MKTHEQIMAESATARQAAKRDAGIWAEGTSFTTENLVADYEDYVVEQLEAGNDDYLDAEGYWEIELGIPKD